MKFKRSLSIILSALFLSTSHGKVITKPEERGDEIKDIKMTPVGTTTFHIISGQIRRLQCPEITAERVEPPKLEGAALAMFTQDIQQRIYMIQQAQMPIPVPSGGPFGFLGGGGGIQGKFLPPNPEGILMFLLENPIMLRIHISAVSSGVAPKPKPLQVEDMPIWCDVILYFHPRQAGILFESYWVPPPTYPTIVQIPESDFAFTIRQMLFKIGTEVSQKEREIFSGLVSLYNSTINSFFDSVKTYTPTITYQIAGRQGQISVDLHWFVNDYSARIHNARKSMTDEDIKSLQYLVYVILTGYRAKGVKYPEDTYDIAIQNLRHIAGLKLFNAPLLPYMHKINLWIMPEGISPYPALNPTITKFLAITPPLIAPPRSVLDVPVLLHLINTHDFSQDTLFTRFIVAYLQKSTLPKVDYADAAKLFEKLKIALKPNVEQTGNVERKDVNKQLDSFIEKALEHRKRITQ